MPDDDVAGCQGPDLVSLDGYTPPDTRSPFDVWHSEQYLLAHLVRCHGWRWIAARTLRGPMPASGVIEGRIVA